MTVAVEALEASVLAGIDPEYQLLIDGEHVSARSGETMPAINPSTGAVITSVARAGADDVADAVSSARAAFDDGRWRRLRASRRAAVLAKVADALEASRLELAQIEALNIGKPLRLAMSEVRLAADAFRHFAGQTALAGEGSVRIDDHTVAYLEREPVGVCAAIIPWNYPLLMAAWKVAPALAFGNAVILKPAEQSPLTALRLGDVCMAAGVPAGVLNVVPGLGAGAGRSLVEHQQVDKIAFTGSTEVGRGIQASAASRFVRTTLELGGKSPSIVFGDADLAAAVRGAAHGIFSNSGQMCTAGSRILVAQDRVDEFTDAFVLATQQLRLGHALADDVDLGPLVSEHQRERVLSYLSLDERDGGEVVTGGTPSGPGFFLSPAVVRGVASSAKIAQEEIFGPVATILPFADIDEAIALANDTEYGLAATVWTRDLKTGRRVAAEVRAGTIWINTTAAFDAAVPFGGRKLSGLGRELGPAAADAYTERKSVWLTTTD